MVAKAFDELYKSTKSDYPSTKRMGDDSFILMHQDRPSVVTQNGNSIVIISPIAPRDRADELTEKEPLTSTISIVPRTVDGEEWLYAKAVYEINSRIEENMKYFLVTMNQLMETYVKYTQTISVVVQGLEKFNEDLAKALKPLNRVVRLLDDPLWKAQFLSAYINSQMKLIQEDSDDDLWILLEQTLNILRQVDEDIKLLADKNKEGKQLSNIEQSLLDALSNNYNELVLFRTEIMVELQERGHDIQSYIESVAPKP